MTKMYEIIAHKPYKLIFRGLHIYKYLNVHLETRIYIYIQNVTENKLDFLIGMFHLLFNLLLHKNL